MQSVYDTLKHFAFILGDTDADIPEAHRNLHRGVKVEGTENDLPVFSKIPYVLRSWVTVDPNTNETKHGTFSLALPAKHVGGQLFVLRFGGQVDTRLQPISDWALPQGGRKCRNNAVGVLVVGTESNSEQKVFIPGATGGSDSPIVADHRGPNATDESSEVLDVANGPVEELRANLAKAFWVAKTPFGVDNEQRTVTTINAYSAGARKGSPVEHQGGAFTLFNTNIQPGINNFHPRVIEWAAESDDGPFYCGLGHKDAHIKGIDAEGVPHLPLMFKTDRTKFGPGPSDQYGGRSPAAPFDFLDQFAKPPRFSLHTYRGEIVYDKTLLHPNPSGIQKLVRGRWVIEYRLPHETPYDDSGVGKTGDPSKVKAPSDPSKEKGPPYDDPGTGKPNDDTDTGKGDPTGAKSDPSNKGENDPEPCKCTDVDDPPGIGPNPGKPSDTSEPKPRPPGGSAALPDDPNDPFPGTPWGKGGQSLPTDDNGNPAIPGQGANNGGPGECGLPGGAPTQPGPVIPSDGPGRNSHPKTQDAQNARANFAISLDNGRAPLNTGARKLSSLLQLQNQREQAHKPKAPMKSHLQVAYPVLKGLIPLPEKEANNRISLSANLSAENRAEIKKWPLASAQIVAYGNNRYGAEGLLANDHAKTVLGGFVVAGSDLQPEQVYSGYTSNLTARFVMRDEARFEFGIPNNDGTVIDSLSMRRANAVDGGADNDELVFDGVLDDTPGSHLQKAVRFDIPIRLVRVSAAQRAAMTPRDGMLVQDTDDGHTYCYDANVAADWVDLSAGGGSGDFLTPITDPGIVVYDGTNQGITRLIESITDGLAVGNGDGQAGNIALSLNHDLAALEALTGTGAVHRTADDTYALRTLTAGSSKVSIGNGNGVAGNPTVDIVEANLTLDNIGGTLDETKGGTGQTTITQGDMLYGSASNTLSKLAKDANATRYLSNTGASNSPAWAQVNLANGVTGTLPSANGGTSFSTYTTGDIIYASAANTLSKLAIGANGKYLKVVAGVPSWEDVTGTLDINGLTAETAGIAANDYFPFYDTTETANNKVSYEHLLSWFANLSALTAPATGDLLVINDVSASDPKARNISLQDMLKVIAQLTTQTPDLDTDADVLPIYDASDALPRKATPEQLGIPFGDITTGDQTVSSTSQTNSGLTVALQTGYYEFEACLFCSSVTGGGFKIDLDGGTVVMTSMRYMAINHGTNTDAEVKAQDVTALATDVTITGTTDTTWHTILRGYLLVGTSGTLTLRFSRTGGAGSARLETGSWMRLRKTFAA